MDSNNQVRVILWSIPRTVSTAFEKCMSNLDDVQIINEPYVSVYFNGPDKKVFPGETPKDIEPFLDMTDAVQVEHGAGWDSETATYKYVKENIVEAEYSGKKVVFVKDMAYAISDKLDMLPKGYRHAFLIRKPIRVFASWKKMFTKFPTVDGKTMNIVRNTWFVPKDYGYGETLQLYRHFITKGIEPNPIIIDSDDLLENPKSILQQFCSRTGISYTDKLLNWKAGEDVLQKWKASSELVKANKVFGFYSDAFESTCFYKPKPEPKRSELHDDVNEAIDAVLPYYEQLYKLRIKPHIEK